MKYLKAAWAAAMGCAILMGIATLVWSVTIPWALNAVVPRGRTWMLIELPGPLGFWGNVWLWATALLFVAVIPKDLVKAHKRGDRPLPGGWKVSDGWAEDVKLLRTGMDWMLAADDAEDAHEAAPGKGKAASIAYPPCPRCGDPVNGYKVKSNGWTLMVFKPCHCRLILSLRRKRERASAAGA